MEQLGSDDHMTPELQDLVIRRLVDTGAAEKGLAFPILAALDGAQALAAYLGGTTTMEVPKAAAITGSAATPIEPPGVYLRSLTVEGFRGVGKATTMEFEPGPGLTLVVGRNGSGKSSFAEGLELLLTGQNARWRGRTKAWCAGWRNLHEHSSVCVAATMIVEGQGTIVAKRTWVGDDCDASTLVLKRPSGEALDFDALGWAHPLVTFRPFLSYNELGSLLEEGPSKLYDKLSGVLGLDEPVAVQNTLAEARKDLQRKLDEAKANAGVLRDEAAAVAEQSLDERVKALRDALSGKTWRLSELEALAGQVEDETPGQAGLLKQLSALTPVDLSALDAAARQLRDAHARREGLAGTSAGRSRDLADLLEKGVRFAQANAAKDCPLCGNADALSESWLSGSREAIGRLRAEARECEQADTEYRRAWREAVQMVTPPPAVLSSSLASSLALATLAAAREAWTNWSAAPPTADAMQLAEHLEQAGLAVHEAVTALVEEARDESRRREDVWKPLAAKLAGWLLLARGVEGVGPRLKELKAAEAWWKDALADLRDQRFRPVREAALSNWKQLRLQSNVNLDDIVLEGTAHRRQVTLSVSVDGAEAVALGVMSQGELHSLALSLFLPRATLPESPFRFVSIDDPVQSMDPARVEGLARVLSDVATRRQVIVFTHDDRLPAASRRLGIPARILTVTRRANSAVAVRLESGPVEAYLDDALALLRTSEMPAAVRCRVIPGFCRSAIEAACMEVVRGRRLGRGEPHDEVERLLGENGRTHPLMALALFDDEKKTGDVLPRLNRLGRWAADTFQLCKQGSHVEVSDDLDTLVSQTGRLTQWLVGGAR